MLSNPELGATEGVSNIIICDYNTLLFATGKVGGIDPVI
jgi:hypothetical protein